MNRIKAVLFLLLFVAPGLTWAGSISGTVTNAGKPVEFVVVGVQGTQLTAMTDENGHFEITDVPPGSYQLEFKSIGYEHFIQEVVVASSSSNVKLTVELSESSGLLGGVVISGTMKEISKTDSPVPVEVYSGEYFKANPTPSIFESLQNVNGVRPQLNCNVCNTGDIHINGLEGPYTMVLIDGMPIVSGLSTVYGLTGIPQSLIERVEIVKGPASTLYGSEAVGGLINIITKKPSNAPIVSADVFGTSWGEINTDIGVKLKAGEKSHGLLGVNYFKYGVPIDNNDDGFTDVTLQDRISVFNTWHFAQKNNKTFSLAGRYVYEDRWGGEMNWSPQHRGGTDVYGESIYTSRWETFGTYELPVKEDITFQFSGNGHNHNSVYGDMVYIAEQYIGFGQLTWSKERGKHQFLTGAAYRYNYYDDNTTATQETTGTLDNAPSQIHLPGGFLQDEITFNERHKVLAGVRYDYNSVHGNILSPRLNYKWNTKDERTTVRLSTGNGYRVANVFTEDHAALTGARTVVFEGELQPETSWNGNLNIVQKFYIKGKTYLGLDFSAFYTHFGNRILPDYETDPNLIIYSNLDGSAVSQGISLNIDLATSKGLKILAGVTAMDVTVEENGERYRQLLTERVSGVWNVSYTFSKLDLKIDYTGNVYGPMRLPLLGDMDDRPEYSPWWSLQNIQITKTFNKGWEIYGGVKNLLNYTPPANSIARAFDPFDEQVTFGAGGEVIPTPNNPNALTFDPSYVFAPNQGIRGFFGVRYTL